MHKGTVFALLAFAAGGFSWTAALAQEAAGDENALGEIIVTAQKRSEPLQQAPLAVSAITAATIEQRGIVDIGTLSAIAPNFTISQQSASTATATVSIRGINESEPILTLDSPNAIYLDGVVIARSAGSIFDIATLDRIEVLRGPQGTLYGRNTTGGAVNLITRAPAEEFRANQTFSAGNFNYKQSRTIVDTGRLGASNVRAQLSFVHKERDGYVDNTATPGDRDPGAYSNDAFRLALAYDNDGPFRANYAFDYSDRRSNAVGSQLTIAGPTFQSLLDASVALGGRAAAVSSDRLDTAYVDPAGGLTDRVSGHNLTLELDLNDKTVLRSITGYRAWENMARNSDNLASNSGLVAFELSPAILAPPFTFTPLGVNPISIYRASAERRQHQFSQEINLVGSIGENTDYVLGAFFFTEKAYEQILGTLAIPIPLGFEVLPGVSTGAAQIRSDLNYHHESESKAVFGQATYRLTDRLSVTGGLRYTWDSKELEERLPRSVNDSADFERMTWMANAKYDFSRNVNVYGRIASGYKSGGFNARGVGGSFQPEKVLSFEAGLKSELLDRRLRLNLAAFQTQYKDLQISQFQSGSGGFFSETVNAGEATYTGIEAEVVAVLAKGLTASGNIGYVDRSYDKYLFRDPVSNALIDVSDTARFAYSAPVTANAALEYNFPKFDFGALSARLDYNYRGRVYFHQLDITAPFNRELSQKPVSTFDARISLSDLKIGSGEAMISLWGRNITDEDYRVSSIDFGALGYGTSVYAEPMTWGVDLNLKY